MPSYKLDRFDRKLLEALQTDGRLPNTELAERIDLSPSPCSRRVRLLEKSRVIKGYSAILDQEKVGLGLTVFVDIKVERHQEKEAEAFCEVVSVMPEVVMAHLVSGESDFLLQVVVPDLCAYKEFLTNTLLKLPGVRDIRSNFAIQTVKSQSPLPLIHLPR